jgi:hypothetical protein
MVEDLMSLHLCGETALGQDHHQRSEAERLGKIGIVEGDADAGFAHHHAETEEQQQRREPDARADPGGDDR